MTLSLGNLTPKTFRHGHRTALPRSSIRDKPRLWRVAWYVSITASPYHFLNAPELTLEYLPQEWRQLPAKDAILDLVARLSSRVFLGDELCRNNDWLRITKDYTIISFKAAIKLGLVPGPLRPLLHWFIPECRLARQSLAESSALINAVLEKRAAENRKAAEEGLEPPTYNDAIEWAEKECKGRPYDAAEFQLTLSLAAIHTTTDLLAQTMLYLASEPELIRPLREEIIQVLKAEGWKKTALYNMKLVDSAFKETQRMKPNSLRRLLLQPVILQR